MGRHDGQDGALFDLWLRRNLSDAYGATLAEPLPQEFEAILAALPERDRDA